MTRGETVSRFAPATVTLAVRQGLGAGIGFLGVVVALALIGPEAYGIYVTAFAIVTTAVPLAQAGLGLTIIRHEVERCMPCCCSAPAACWSSVRSSPERLSPAVLRPWPDRRC